jgi:hypothetical protein
MPVKKLLWLSLSLLLAAYTTLGYFLSSWTVPWVVWLFVMAFALVQAILLTSVSKDFRTSMGNWIGSDIGHLMAISAGALSVTVVLVWFHIFQYILMIGSTEILARVELHFYGLNRPQSLGVLTGTSLLGLGLGWTVSTWAYV